MDLIYDIYNHNASTKINIKEYFQDYSKAIKFQNCHMPATAKTNQGICEIMEAQLETEEYNMIVDYCSPDRLRFEGEEVSKTKNSQRMRYKSIYKPKEVPPDIELHTIRELKKRLAKTAKCQSLKYKSEAFINYEKVEDLDGDQAAPGKDILIYIRVYEPFAHTPTGIEQNSPKVQLHSVIVMLGSQTLAQLRDRIICISDLSICRESSENPQKRPDKLAKDVYKSGFFFIENTFYNDSRDSACFDYSDVIVNWAEPRKIGPFQTSSMEYTRIDSLQVRFGFPWVYQHQGSCEHLIVLSDARLVGPDDDLAVSSYPRIHRLKPRASKYCMMCGIFPVHWITTDNDRVPHNPCYFCDKCFDSFNYIDGRKVGKFKAYAFPCHPELMEETIDLD